MAGPVFATLQKSRIPRQRVRDPYGQNVMTVRLLCFSRHQRGNRDPSLRSGFHKNGAEALAAARRIRTLPLLTPFLRVGRLEWQLAGI